MKVFIGGDHAGFQLKGELKEYLRGLGYEIEDMGPMQLDPADDYPDYVIPLAKAVAQNPGSKGIIVAGSGQGEIMCANKIRGIRAALLYDDYSSRISRDHNDANIASLGARVLDAHGAKRLVKLWLETPFSQEERHRRRIEKIRKAEESEESAVGQVF